MKKTIVTTLSLIIILTLAMTGISLHASDYKVPVIPMKDFYRNFEKSSFQLSPQGDYLSFLQPWKNRMNIHVQKIGEEKTTRLTGATERDIRGYFWANNIRIVYILDKGGDENFKAYAVNIDGSNPKVLTPFDKVKVQIIDDLRNIPDEMLLAMNKRDKRIFDVYRVNIVTGKLDMIAKNPGNISGWITDHNGKLRIATTTDGVNTSLLYREKESDPFKTIKTTTFKETLAPLFFTYDNKYIYVSSNIGRDKAAIFKYDVANGKFMEKIFEHPEVDVANLINSDHEKKILGVIYTTDKPHYHFFDKTFKKLYEDLQKRLPGYMIIAANASRDESKLLLVKMSDKKVGVYYHFDRTTGKLKELMDLAPWLKEEHLAEMKPISYKSRDGLTIPGYLTLPKGVKAKNLPTVVMPHGGPWARDNWQYHPTVQFLANRGYAVLQMNFRGSIGYGRGFWEKSFKQWGRTMQDDITDGTKWLIKKGIADPKRIGIYGGSYGGYATLAGLTFTPDLYACGIDYVGVSSIFSWMKAIPPYWKPYQEMIYEMVGHPEKDKELLKAVSPLFHVDKIKVPLLVVQGANDPRVPKAESDQLVEALKKRGIDVPYMVKDNEGHGFGNEENRFDFYRAMEGFFGKHLGGRIENINKTEQ